MAKSSASERTAEGVAAMQHTIKNIRQSTHQAEERYGQDSFENREARLILAAMYFVAEDYEQVESLLTEYRAAANGKRPPNPKEMFWALAMLFEAYANLNRIPEAIVVSAEGKAVAKEIDPSASDPFLEALVKWSTSLEAQGDAESRQRGFVAALVTLCWYVSHGFDGSKPDAPVYEQLQILFKSYGIHGDEWEWTVKHAHLTKYDFIGLLSILLHQTGLAPRPLKTMMRQKPRVVVVR